MKLAKRTALIRASPIRKIAAMLERASAEHDIISFGGGAPSLAPPREMTEHLAGLLRKEPQKTVSYGSTHGMPQVLDLIGELLRREEGVRLDAEEQVLLTEGGTEGLFLALAATVNPGDEVVIADPTYLGYSEPIRLLGGDPVRVPVHLKDDFQLTADAVERRMSRRTKALIMLSPDNPTGRVLWKNNLKALVELCERRHLWLITDDIYKDILFEGRFTNSRRFGGLDNTITCCSFSKTASIPGFRLGYSYGPAAVINKMCELKQYVSLCPSKPAQLCLEKFLENKAAVKRRYLAKTVMPTYAARRKAMARCLKEHMPWARFWIPAGAFYFFPDVSAYLRHLRMDTDAFCAMLLKREHVVAIPGDYFGPGGRNNIRLTFVSEPEQRIEEGFRRIARLLA